MVYLNGRFSASHGLILCFLVSYLFAGCSQPSGETRRTILEHEGSITGLAPPEQVSVAAQKGDILQFVLEQSGLDLYLEHNVAGGEKATNFESLTGRYGEERVVTAVVHDGPVTIKIGAVRLPKITGRYKLVVSRINEMEPADKAYSDASRRQEKVDLVKRVELLESAAREYANEQMWREEGLAALMSVNLLNETAQDAARAIASGERAVTAFRKIQAPLLRASAANALAWAYSEAGDLGRMNESFDEARKYYEAGGSAIGLLEVELYKLSGNHSGLAAADRLAALKRVEDECAAIYETICQAQALSSIGILLTEDAHYEEAFDALYGALSLVDIEADPAMYAHFSDNLAFSLRLLGDFDGAIQHHRAALAAYAKYGDCYGETRSLYGLGYTLLGVGDTEQALRFYQLVLSRSCTVDQLNVAPVAAGSDLSIYKLCDAAASAEFKSETEMAIATWAAYDLGNAARAESGPATALVCHELSLKLAERRTKADGDRVGAKLEKVRDLIELNRGSEAQELYSEVKRVELGAAHPWYRAQGAEVDAMLLESRGDRAAYERYREAADELGAVGNHEGVYSAYSRRASLAKNRGDARTDEYFADADAALEDVRMLSFDPTYSASLFASGRKIYEEWIESALARNRREPEQERALRALAISERSRGRLLAQVAGTSGSGVEARAARLRFLSGDMGESLRRAEAGQQPAAPEKAEERPPSTVDHAYDVGAHRYDAKAMRSAIERLRAFQRSLKEGETVVEYMLGETRSLAWVLRRDRVAMVELPAAPIVRDATEIARALLARAAPIDETKGALARVYELIVEPVIDLAPGEHLAIIPDDVLHEVPFAALWDERGKQFLIERVSLTYLPSILFVVGRESRPSTAGPMKALLIGDPVYEERDAVQRCALRRGSRDPLAQPVNLRRIPASGREVQAIEAVFRSHQSSPTVLTGCAANRGRVLEDTLDSYRYIHFATHATADRVVPQRSAIYLSSYGEGGVSISPELTAADFLKRKFKADLIVLSGCSTAGGRQYRGEGALGLSFSMVASGSRQVLSTLWPVADAAGVSAMGRLYEEMISGRQTVASALRAAQLEMLASKRWSHPWHWAAYTLLGM